MFFRLKETRTGQVLKLVESYRDPAERPRHRAVASLGNAPLARKDWKPVAKAVEDRLYGRVVLLARDPSAEHAAWVDRIAHPGNLEARFTNALLYDHPVAYPRRANASDPQGRAP